jgi:2-isopropylmalate synthase
VHAVTQGIDALGEVTVRIEGTNGHSAHPNRRRLDAQHETTQPRTFGGHGADTDIVVASAKAYLAALNKLIIAHGEHSKPAETELTAAPENV